MYNWTINNLTFNPTVKEELVSCLQTTTSTQNNFILILTLFTLILIYFYIATLDTYKLKNFSVYSEQIRRILFSIMTITISLFSVYLTYYFFY